MLYIFNNGPMPTTGPVAKVSTGTSTKTMLQIKPLVPMRIVEWGASYDGSSAATPGTVELIDTGTIFATVTAFVTADIGRYDGEAQQFGDPTSNYVSVGTAASGYTATAEGSITSTTYLGGAQLIAPTNQFLQQFPLGYRPYIKANDCCRIRMTFATAINALCYVICEF
jgi:hypothetical protein